MTMGYLQTLLEKYQAKFVFRFMAWKYFFHMYQNKISVMPVEYVDRSLPHKLLGLPALPQQFCVNVRSYLRFRTLLSTKVLCFCRPPCCTKKDARGMCFTQIQSTFEEKLKVFSTEYCRTLPNDLNRNMQETTQII